MVKYLNYQCVNKWKPAQWQTKIFKNDHIIVLKRDCRAKSTLVVFFESKHWKVSFSSRFLLIMSAHGFDFRLLTRKSVEKRLDFSPSGHVPEFGVLHLDNFLSHQWCPGVLDVVAPLSLLILFPLCMLGVPHPSNPSLLVTVLQQVVDWSWGPSWDAKGHEVWRHFLGIR